MTETQELTPQERVIADRVMDASYTKDADRWKDSYTNHTATALTRRARAAQNGHQTNQEVQGIPDTDTPHTSQTKGL